MTQRDFNHGVHEGKREDTEGKASLFEEPLRFFYHRGHRGKRRGLKGKSFAFWRTFEVYKNLEGFLLIHRSGSEGFFTTEFTEGKGEDSRVKASLFGEPLKVYLPLRSQREKERTQRESFAFKRDFDFSFKIKSHRF